MKITSSVIRLSTTGRSPALLAAIQRSTSSRISRSSLVISVSSSCGRLLLVSRSNSFRHFSESRYPRASGKHRSCGPWIPAFAGMTEENVGEVAPRRPIGGNRSGGNARSHLWHAALVVSPAKAGVQGRAASCSPCGPWIPAFAGMTGEGEGDSIRPNCLPASRSAAWPSAACAVDSRRIKVGAVLTMTLWGAPPSMRSTRRSTARRAISSTGRPMVVSGGPR